MLTENKAILRAKNEKIYIKLLNNINETCEIISTKNEEKTIIITKDGNNISYHSRYNPTKEVQTYLEKQLNTETEYILLIGVGLGYAIKELTSKYPNIRFSVFEPNLDVMSCFLQTFDLRKIRERNFDLIFSDISEVKNIPEFYNKINEEKSQIIVSPIALNLYNEEIINFMKKLKKYMDNKKSSTRVDLFFQKRWTYNAIANFSSVLNTPNFFKNVEIEKLRNKPAIIVAAGPSLDDEIENIREIKRLGAAYIFAVGSAVNTLIKYDILPDAVFSYDPTPENNDVLKKIKELNLNIPLIFGSTIGYESLQGYQGKKIHFFMAQDSFNTNIINHNCNIIIPDAPTVAAIALYIVGGIKMNPVILVGQNLSVTQDKTYSDGIDYFGDVVKNKETFGCHLEEVSTTNNTIYTSDSFIQMKNILEQYIVDVGLEGKIFNATKKGLPINGAPFKSLEDIMQELLGDSVVDHEIFNVEGNYDVKDALATFKNYEKDFDVLIKDFKDLIAMDEKILAIQESKVISKLNEYFIKFNNLFTKIEKNDFFMQIIAPTTRHQYKQLVEKSRAVEMEKRPFVKIKKYQDSYSKYIRTMYLAIYDIQPAFAEIKKSDLYKKEDSQ